MAQAVFLFPSPERIGTNNHEEGKNELVWPTCSASCNYWSFELAVGGSISVGCSGCPVWRGDYAGFLGH